MLRLTAEHLRATHVTFDEDSKPYSFSLDDALLRIETMTTPTIAAINGNCLGAGFEFTLVPIAHRRRRSLPHRLARSHRRHPAGGGGTQRCLD